MAKHKRSNKASMDGTHPLIVVPPMYALGMHNYRRRGLGFSLGAAPMPMRTKLLIGGGLALIAIVAMNRQTIAAAAGTAAEKIKEAAMSAAGTILNLNSIRKAMPKLKASTVPDILGPLVEALEEAQINTPARIAAFVAQCGHESGDFRYMEELADGSAYEGRKDLGNTQPGDGKRYKGRGPIQLTGRKNYQAFTADVGKKYNVDFEKNPELVAQPKWGFKAAAWFWTTRNLNALADDGKFAEITYRVNGGCNGFSDRDQRYQTARDALGVTVPWVKVFKHAKQGMSVCCMKDGKYAVCPAPTGSV